MLILLNHCLAIAYSHLAPHLCSRRLVSHNASLLQQLDDREHGQEQSRCKYCAGSTVCYRVLHIRVPNRNFDDRRHKTHRSTVSHSGARRSAVVSVRAESPTPHRAVDKHSMRGTKAIGVTVGCTTASTSHTGIFVATTLTKSPPRQCWYHSPSPWFHNRGQHGQRRGQGCIRQ